MNKDVAVIIASRENPLYCVRDVLEKRGIDCEVVMREDHMSYESLKALNDSCVEKYGKVDYLVYSALLDRACFGKSWHELKSEEYSDWKYLALDYFYEVTRAFVPKMKEFGGGVILAVCDQAGVMPMRGHALSGAASAAAIMHVKCMGEELSGDGIYTSAVTLGGIEENDNLCAVPLSAKVVEHVPGNTVITEQQAAQKIADVLLMTDSAMTATVVQVDGGLSSAYMRNF